MYDIKYIYVNWNMTKIEKWFKLYVDLVYIVCNIMLVLALSLCKIMTNGAMSHYTSGWCMCTMYIRTIYYLIISIMNQSNQVTLNRFDS